MTNETYGPWIIWNGGECPVANGVKRQVQLGNMTRAKAEEMQAFSVGIYRWAWGSEGRFGDIIAYRLLIEPKVETVMLFGRSYGGMWDLDRNQRQALDTHKITFTTTDGIPDCESVKMEALK